MNDPIDILRSRQDGVTVPRIGVMIAVSVLIHLLALLGLPSMKVHLPSDSDSPEKAGALTLRLAPPFPPSAPATPAPSAPQAPVRRPAPVVKPPAAPPVASAGGGSPAAAERAWRMGFGGLPPRLDVQTAIQNIIDEIVGLYLTTLYKLRFLA